MDSDHPAFTSGLHLDSGSSSHSGFSMESDLGVDPGMSLELDSSITLSLGVILRLAVTYAPSTRPKYRMQHVRSGGATFCRNLIPEVSGLYTKGDISHQV